MLLGWVLTCRASCSRQVAAAERISKLSLPGNRVGLKITGFVVCVGIGSIRAMADEEAPVEKSWEIVKVIDTATPGVYLAKLKKYSVLTEAPESDDNTLLVYPTVALRDVSTDATRRISLPHLTTKLWVVDAPERPADSVCKGIIRANGLRKVSSLTLGQHTAELVNARKLLDLPVERENRPARVESDVEESEEEAERLTEVSFYSQTGVGVLVSPSDLGKP